MKFRVTFEFDSAREAVGFLQGIDGEKAVEAEREQPTVTVSEAPAKVTKKAPAKVKAVAKPEPDEAPPEVKPEPEATEAVDKDTAAAALNDLYAKHGLEVSKDVLGRFGVRRFGDLKPEQYGAFKAMCDQVMIDGKV